MSRAFFPPTHPSTIPGTVDQLPSFVDEVEDPLSLERTSLEAKVASLQERELAIIPVMYVIV